MINLDEIRARCERYRTREIDHVYIETYLVDVEGLLSGHADLTRKLAKCEHMLATYQNTIVPELRTRLAEATAERDAAVEDIKENWLCYVCKNRVKGKEWVYCENLKYCISESEGGDGCGNFEWRGKKEDTDHA